MSTLKERIAAAALQLDAAKSLVSDVDREEIKDREDLAKHLDATRVARREARTLALARELDASRIRYGQNVLDVLDLEDKAEGGGAYVLRNPPGADASEWQARMADTTDAKERNRHDRNFAMASVVAWVETKADGTFAVRNLDDDKDAAPALHLLWTGRAPFAPMSINNMATELGGFAAAKRKS